MRRAAAQRYDPSLAGALAPIPLGERAALFEARMQVRKLQQESHAATHRPVPHLCLCAFPLLLLPMQERQEMQAGHAGAQPCHQGRLYRPWPRP